MTIITDKEEDEQIQHFRDAADFSERLMNFEISDDIHPMSSALGLMLTVKMMYRTVAEISDVASEEEYIKALLEISELFTVTEQSVQ